eukprot:snap_masked-scaffold_47-processed-gene-1.67-mRNA-1 protein AED:0.40 eAED:0.40 QI:0/-1/0/1/-1/1/1/0/570
MEPIFSKSTKSTEQTRKEEERIESNDIVTKRIVSTASKLIKSYKSVKNPADKLLEAELPKKYAQSKKTELANRRVVNQTKSNIESAIISSARASILSSRTLTDNSRLLTTDRSDPSEKATYEITQTELKPHLNTATEAKLFNFTFPRGLGPYKTCYSANGRYMALAGTSAGHICALDCLKSDQLYERMIRDRVNDMTFLHSHRFLAVAQNKNTFIYDHVGLELHRLSKHHYAKYLTFLRPFFLLASAAENGKVVWQDTSTGEVVKYTKTKRQVASMTHNKTNGVLSVGSKTGVVSLWTPNQDSSVMEILAHSGRVNGMGFDRSGQYLVSLGVNLQVKIWDLRKTNDLMNSFRTNRVASGVTISDTNLLGLNFGNTVKVWKDSIFTEDFDQNEKAYMVHHMKDRSCRINDIVFRPYEDILSLGTDTGLKNLVVPGSGMSDFDAFEANPYEERKQLVEREVKNLLEKLQPEMISLDPDQSFIGKLRAEEDSENFVQPKIVIRKKDKSKKRMRGRGKAGKAEKNQDALYRQEGRKLLQEKLEASKNNREKPAVEKIIDEDGFELVQYKKRRYK